jgi:hypothetical protein
MEPKAFQECQDMKGFQVSLEKLLDMEFCFSYRAEDEFCEYILQCSSSSKIIVCFR